VYSRGPAPDRDRLTLGRRLWLPSFLIVVNESGRKGLSGRACYRAKRN
jgi:hypothetical protein